MPRPDLCKRWLIGTPDPEISLELKEGLGVSPLTARILAARGFSDLQAAKTFLHPKLSSLPHPNLLPGMEKAAERLALAVATGERIWVYTDFDADGVTSAALLSTLFSSLGANFKTWLPRRDREGYGLHEEPLREFAREGKGVVVTADCGITALGPALAAKELGLDLIITDHHTPLPELPQAHAVVNPKLPGAAYPDTMIAGVGVAWNLAWSLILTLRGQGWFQGRAEPDVKELLDFVALGTVADVAPLTSVNRVFAAAGLSRMNRDRRAGLVALAEVAGVKGEINSGHLGFQLGPRINAAGRMEGPEAALELLVADDKAAALKAAQLLDRLNRERRDEEGEVLALAVSEIEERRCHPDCYAIVVAGESFHPGVVGIVASRLVERYHRPAVVLSIDGETAKGSARSIPGVDLYEALSSVSHHFTRFGGHKAAAGLSLNTADIPAFMESFEERLRLTVSPETLIPEVYADTTADPAELTTEAVLELSRLAPFGFGNPTPALALMGLRVVRRVAMGKEGEHLKLFLEKDGLTLEAVAWNKAGAFTFAVQGARIDLVASAKVNAFRGVSSVGLALVDARISPDA